MQEIGMRAEGVHLEGIENVWVGSPKELSKGIKSGRIQHTWILADGFKWYAAC